MFLNYFINFLSLVIYSVNCCTFCSLRDIVIPFLFVDGKVFFKHFFNVTFGNTMA